jgi:hypothetical protein
MDFNYSNVGRLNVSTPDGTKLRRETWSFEMWCTILRKLLSKVSMAYVITRIFDWQKCKMAEVHFLVGSEFFLRAINSVLVL